MNRLQPGRNFNPAYPGHGDCHFTTICYDSSAHLKHYGILSVHLWFLTFQFRWMSISYQETGKVFHFQIFLKCAIFEKCNKLVCFHLKSCAGHCVDGVSGSHTKPIRMASCDCHIFPELVTSHVVMFTKILCTFLKVSIFGLVLILAFSIVLMALFQDPFVVVSRLIIIIQLMSQE